MKRILFVIFYFFISGLPLCNSVEQNIQQEQLNKSASSNSKNSVWNGLASYFLFFGTRDDSKRLRNLEEKFIIEELNIDWNSIKIHGYVFKPKDKLYDKVCICFGSDFRPCHRMVTTATDDSILYVCVDYPGFGQSEYIRMNERILTNFANMVYDYVSKNYKDCDLIVFGFSLGGFSASLMCSKERIKKVVLVSPIYLTGMLSKFFSESKSKYLVNLLWGYELNSLKNIFECNRDCDILLYSGDEKDFLSLYHTLPFYFRSHLKNEKSNKQKLDKVKSIIEKDYKNLNIGVSIYENCWHHQIHPRVIKENKDLFSLDKSKSICDLDAA